jgi:superfamily II DNA or RNA helicase
MGFFELNGLNPYDYQTDFIDNHFVKIKELKLILLAAAPGAGKTVTSIACIEKFLEDNPDARVLVLTHNQNVLKEQYYDAILNHKVSFTHSKDVNSDAQVIVTIPAALNRKESLPKFDLIIVDEAHHFYETKKDEGMVKRIIKETGAKYEVLLTGSPSKFNGKGIHTFAVTINDLYDRGQCSDVIIEIATTNYSLSHTDYNTNYELKESAYKKETKADVERTLENVLDKIQRRLQSWHKNNPELYSKLDRNAGWLPVLGELNKTIFACKSIKQADRVAEYLNNKGVKAVVSHSKNDSDSQQIDLFRTDDSIMVLVVVDRGTLGFNMAELENVIDMTGSQNIDRITQLLCRVNRVHPDIKNKLFIKVAPINQVDYMHAIMTAVVCMFDREWFLKYNGKNFLDIVVPVMKEKRERRGETTGTKKQSKKVKMVDFIGLPAIEFFKTLNHKRDDVFSGVEYTTVRDVRAKLLDLKESKPRNYWTDSSIKEEALKYKTKNEWKKNSNSSYTIALSNKELFKECIQHMEYDGYSFEYGYWNLKNCKQSASQYNTKKEWRENYPSAYTVAFKNGWLDECCAHMIYLKKNVTYEEAKTESLKYSRKIDWNKNSPETVRWSRLNGYYDEFASHMKSNLKPDTYYTKEKCFELFKPIKTIKKLKDRYPSAYRIAYENNWLEELTSHMTKERFLWKEKDIEIIAKKYKFKEEFKKFDRNAYDAARTINNKKPGFMNMICSHMIKLRIPNFWTFENCKEDALKYKKRNEWRLNSGSAYQKASQKGWLDECCAHMK